MSQAKLFAWVFVVPGGLEGLLYQYCLMTVPTGLITASPPCCSDKHFHVTLSKLRHADGLHFENGSRNFLGNVGNIAHYHAGPPPERQDEYQISLKLHFSSTKSTTSNV